MAIALAAGTSGLLEREGLSRSTLVVFAGDNGMPFPGAKGSLYDPGVRVPLLARRVVTLIPALLILGAGFDPTQALVLSQVFLSFGIPFALVPLVLFTRDRELMGGLVNRRVTTAAAAIIATVIICLNVYLLEQTFFG